MGNFSWTNFKPFVIIYLVCCVLAYSLSPGVQSSISYEHKKEKFVREWSPQDLDMIYDMYFDEDLIQLRKQIELDTIKNQGTMVVSEL